MKEFYKKQEKEFEQKQKDEQDQKDKRRIEIKQKTKITFHPDLMVQMLVNGDQVSPKSEKGEIK